MKPTNNNIIVCGLVCWNQCRTFFLWNSWIPCSKFLQDDLGFGGKTLVFCEYTFIRLSTIVQTLLYQTLRAQFSTPSCLHHRLPKSFNEDLLSTFVQINVGRESIFRTFRTYFANSRIRNYF